LLRGNYTNLNHGSYGTVPKPVFKRMNEYYLEQEQAPDIWFRQTVNPLIDEARKQLASFVHASDANDLVLVESASSAVNSIVRTIKLNQGDKVLRLSTAYGMVINVVNYVAEVAGVEVVVVDIGFPVDGDAQYIDAVKKALDENPGVKLCIFSHISSVPSVTEPVKQLTALAKSAGSLVLIDGAHAPGAIPIRVEDIGADFYLGNAHKWLFSPKGSAFLWVAKSQQKTDSPEPTTISTNFDDTFTNRYEHTGTRDYTAYTSIPAALDFINNILGGVDQVMEHNHELIVRASEMLMTKWNTTSMVPFSMCGSMTDIILPSTDPAAVSQMATDLYVNHGIYVVAAGPQPSKVEGGRDMFFVRLSANVYNTMEDFERLAVLVPNLLNNYKSRTSENKLPPAAPKKFDFIYPMV
jgi:selenocysteine lyase/cysteine desulfurase